MVDIALCTTPTCPKRHTCYRQHGKADAAQQYIRPEATANGCDLYWPIRSKSEVRRLNHQLSEDCE